ncbi:MAG: carboxypeptidase regulatory-like domain-containing protein, partial [Candidatus Acidiferrum sp.]
MRKLASKYLGLFLFVAGISSACLGQNITATLTGTVTDPSGAAVAGAAVIIHNNNTNADVRTVNTDQVGLYNVPDLPFGTYTVTVKATGFKNSVASEVILHVGDHRTLNLTMEVGQISEKVFVTTSEVPVETSSAAQSTTITGTQIRELQLNNRNFEQLLLLEPGVASGLPDQIQFGISNTDSVSVNGARGSANNWTVDGSDVNDSGSNLTLLNVPSVDALAEFTLVRSTYDAQYGRSGGGQVNVVTKSGTSDFHGEAYEFVRNNVFNANSFFLNSSKTPRPPFRYNDFGYTFGGPVFIPGHYNTDRTKTFFFWSQEWRRTRTPSTIIFALPNPQELTGNFQGLVNSNGTPVILNSASAPAGCINGNQINTSCFSSNAMAYLQNVYSKFAPSASSLPTAQLTANFIVPESAANNFRQEILRVDQKITNKIQVFGRYMQDSVPTTEPGGLFAGAGLPGISSTSTNAPGRNFVVHATMQLAPTILNEVAYNYSRGQINSTITGSIDSSTFLGAIGTGAFPFSDPYGRVPGITITGVTGVGIPVSPYHELNVDNQIYDNFTLVRGNHSIRAGVSVQLMQKSENAVNPTNGSFSFRNAYGNPAFANFLLGNASQFTQASRDIIPNLHFPNIEAYVQDDWKIRPNLTLNLGLRYAYFATPADNAQILDNFSPAVYSSANAPAIDPISGNFVAAQGVTPANYANGIIVGQNGCVPSTYFEPPVSPFGPTCSPYGDRVNPTYNTFAPRVGFAWDPFGRGKTSVRGGYGIYFDRTLNGIQEQNSFANPPFVGSVLSQNTSFDNPTNGAVTPLGPVALHATGLPGFKVPSNQQWNLSIQHEILPNTLLEAAYVGSKGTHLLGEFDLNQVALAIREANPTDATNALRPFLGYGPITDIGSEFNSNYHALQLSLNRRVSQGLNLGVAYTWSKTLTNNPSDRSDA